MVSVFPSPVTRTATSSFLAFDALRWATLPALLAERAALHHRQQQLQAELNATLYQLIQDPAHAALSARLLHLKRAVFNGRPVGAAAHPPDLPPALRPPLLAYEHVLTQLAAWETAFEQAYQHQLLAARRHLQALAQQENLRCGLHLASETLLTQLPRYWQTAAVDFRKREHHLELGLLRYLTRLHFKTSPFSTFTAVGVSTLARVPGLLEWPTGNVPYRSVVRLNNNLLAYLKTLLGLVPELREALPVRLNPSVTTQAGSYHFVLNHHNVEAFQTLAGHELLAVVAAELRAAGGWLSLGALAQRLAADHVEAPLPALLAWLLPLVDCGFLEIDLGASGTDPDWDQALRRQLLPLADGHPVVREVLALLHLLRTLAADYAQSPASARGPQRQAMLAAFRQVEGQLREAAGQAPVGAVSPQAYRAAYAQQYEPAEAFIIRPFLHADFPLLYEDAAHATAGQLDATAVQQAAECLQRWLSCWPLAAAEPTRQRAYFLARYATQAEVPLLTFYQTYVAEVRKPAQAHATQEAAATPAEPAWLAACLAEALPTYAPVVTLRLPAEASQPAAIAQRGPTATAAYSQFFTEAQPGSAPVLRGVINGLLPGLGKGSGRFLHLFGPETTRAFQAWNRDFYPAPALAAELADASYSNANLHPPLLPWQLVLPGGHASHPASQQLSVADLVVRDCPQQQRLDLWHLPSGRPVRPHDVGLQARATRSELYQFLTAFGEEGATSLAPLLQAVGHYCRTQFPAQTAPLPGVARYPRVQLEAGLVVQRQRWYVAAAAVPTRAKAESASQYLRRLAAWRQQLELPAEVFYYLRLGGEPVAPGPPAGADDYKPQYLHFDNVLLVRLLEQQLPKAGERLLFEEMYPDSATLSQQGQAHVRETLVEWQHRPPASPPAPAP